MAVHSFKADSYNQFLRKAPLVFTSVNMYPLPSVLSLSSTVRLKEHHQEIHNKI